jgi:hypothetical protein
MKRLKVSPFVSLGTVFGLMLWLAPFYPTWADTSQSTADFLKKLNGYYYCLSRAGLKNYHCDLSCSLSPDSEKSLRAAGVYNEKLWEALKSFRFSIDDTSGQPISIQGAQPPQTGNVALDSRIAKLDENILEAVKAFSQFWKAFVVEPLNDPADLEQGNLKFQRLSDGFQVTQADPAAGTVAVIFDKKGKMLEFSMEGNGPKTIVKPDFVYAARGYVLQGLSFTGSDASQDCKLEYGLESGFWMPKNLTLRVQLQEMPSADIELLFDFYNYQINK